MKFTKQWVVDTLERTVATYLEVLFGLLIAQWTTDKLDLSLLATAALAAVPAALTVLKSAVAELKGGTVSPASFAPEA